MAPDKSIPSVKTNYFFNTFLNLTNILYPLVTFAYVSRVLGPSTFGKVIFASSFVGYFLLLAGLGIPVYGSREIARVRNDPEALTRMFSELFFINLCSSAVSLLLFVVPLFFVDKLRQETILFLVTGGMIAANFFFVDWLFQGVENYRNIAVRSVCFKTIGLALLFVTVHRESDYIWYAAINVVSAVGTSAWGFVYSKKYVRLRWSHFTRSMFAHLKPIIILFSVACTVCIYIYLDSVLLGFLAGDSAVGLYSTAVKITRTVVVVVTSMSMVLVPRISFYLKNNLHDEYTNVTRKSMHFIFFLALPLTVGLFLLAPHIVSVLAGTKFAGAIVAIRITSPLIVILGISNFYSLQILYPNGQESKLFLAVLCAAVVDVGLNLALIPPYSYKGAAIASLAAELTALAIMMLMTKKQYMAFRLIDKRTILYGCASAFMGIGIFVVMRFIHDPIPSLLLSFVVGTILYGGMLFGAKDPLMREIVLFVTTKGLTGIGRVLK